MDILISYLNKITENRNNVKTLYEKKEIEVDVFFFRSLVYHKLYVFVIRKSRRNVAEVNYM